MGVLVEAESAELNSHDSYSSEGRDEDDEAHHPAVQTGCSTEPEKDDHEPRDLGHRKDQTEYGEHAGLLSVTGEGRHLEAVAEVHDLSPDSRAALVGFDIAQGDFTGRGEALAGGVFECVVG